MPLVTLKGTSGTSYDFEVHNVGTNFNAIAGVYALLSSSGSPYSVLYIGEAQSLFQRLNIDPESGNHDGYDCARRRALTHIAVRRVNGGKQARLDVEADLVDYYDPVCNK